MRIICIKEESGAVLSVASDFFLCVLFFIAGFILVTHWLCEM